MNMAFKDKIYLDYNATSPLSDSVKALLGKGDVFLYNPSSQHSSGKKTNKLIREVGQNLLNYFGLGKTHEIFYHSGATEGLNTLLAPRSDDYALAIMGTDHSCVHAIKKAWEKNDLTTFVLPVGSDGKLVFDECCELFKQAKDKKILMNVNYMNNETGVVQNLLDIAKLKKEFSLEVHVDAAQIVGKVHDFQKLLVDLDYYTFSGHKFGALTGIGFSFYKKELTPKALLYGGGQQNGVRPGTLNSYGIMSLKEALMEINGGKVKDLEVLKDKIQGRLQSVPNIDLIQNESANTICFTHKEKKSDVMLMLFDLNGLEVSAGSACQSGSFSSSHVLEAMRIEYAANVIRLSLGKESLNQENEILKRLDIILAKL